jgi:hypothetical protein
MALRIVEVWFRALCRDGCDPIDVLFCDAFAERDGDVHEPTSLGERAGALGRVARRGAREFAVVPRVDDRQNRSGVGGRVATILRDGVTGPPGSSAGTASCAASDTELIDHCRRSVRTRRSDRGSRSVLRAGVGGTPSTSRLARGGSTTSSASSPIQLSVTNSRRRPRGAFATARRLERLER